MKSDDGGGFECVTKGLQYYAQRFLNNQKKMSADSLSASPIGFTVYSVIAAGMSFVFAAVYSSPMLIVAYTTSRIWFLLAIIFLLAFSLAKSQDIAKRQDLYSINGDVPRHLQIIGLVINFVYMNLVLLAAVVIGGMLIRLFAFETGLFIVSIIIPAYGFWEIETRSRGWPISVGGALIWVAAIVYIAVWGARTLLQWIWTADWSEIKEKLDSVREGILRVMSLSEESPIHSAADRYSR